ncbi:endonuclease/exonuclease/phosphatase family protein [Xanthomonas sp. NCPPB 2654]|uniref:endonuclease/exonuclease/phosphatase family protein n=1 Tax=unclassified Xanthomonas TaxID=2643310 RepID=UPI0021DFE3D5|nr:MULTISPECIES: endonuclease/exonuclease/phosphatase family protein [unclassified Xanthomonas]MDL5366259.1 endonuclease/exonuclease/phosphatase family protein [Xanthomonas sp. NCPPB 2654]UYC19060.1 endonuclease/exonuclease/phosphatase family protein [Xanthomonas sp. CFBP 8443]
MMGTTRRWHRLGWLLLALVATARAQSLPAGLPAAPATPPGAALSVVSLNLEQDRNDWPARRVRIVDALRRLQPDAIALQEVLQTPELPNQAHWLAAQLGYHCHFISADPPSRPQRRGNALLTRLPVLEEAETLLHPFEDYSVAGLVRVDLHGQPVNLYFTRLHAERDGGANRREQADDLMAWIDATAEGVPALLAGGFFAAADAPELAPLAARFGDSDARLRGARAEEAPRNGLDPRVFALPAQADHVFFERGRFRPLRSTRLLPRAPGAARGADPRGLLVALQPLDPPPEDAIPPLPGS